MIDSWLIKQKAKINPIHSYERTWQRIVSALTAETTFTRHQLAYYSGWQPVSQPTLDCRPRLCTPLDRAALEKEAKKKLIDQEHHRPKIILKQRFSFGKTAGTESLEGCSRVFTAESPQSRRSKEAPSNSRSRYRPLSSFYSKKKTVRTQKQQPPSSREIAKSISQRAYIRPFVPPANMTAYAYIVYELPENIHVCWNSQNSVEIASLTKIMTCLVALRVAEATNQSIQRSVLIGSVETNIPGTTANLQKNCRYTIEELLYGLMLPSGNDASLALAVWAGRMIHLRNNGQGKMCYSEENPPLKKREAIALFVEEMNSVAKEIGMKKTKYANTHGLSNNENKSTALDIALLCKYAMKNQTFRKIVSTESYSGTTLGLDGSVKEYTWNNTHRLLSKLEYLGIKTGMTTTAGACLASYLRLGCRDFIIVVLGCRHVERRFKETEILRRWVMKKEGLARPSKEEEEEEDQIMVVDGSCEFD